MIVGGADIDALGGNVNVACSGNITAGLAVGAAGIYPYAAFQAADLAGGLQGFFALVLAAIFHPAAKVLGVGNNGTADAGRNLALALALAVFGGADVDVTAGFKQQVVLGDQTAAADGDIAFFGKQTGFTAHGQGAAADAADLARSLPLIVKGAEGGDMVAVVDGETATLAAAGLPAAVGRGQQPDVVAGIQQGIAFGGDLCASGFDAAFGGTDAEMAAGRQRAADGFGAAAILRLRAAAAAAGTIRAEPKPSSRLKASVPKCKRQPEWGFGLPLICIMES